MYINPFATTSFETAGFLIESSQSPKIKMGGSSNSDILNRYFLSLCQDMSLLTTRTNLLADRANRIEQFCSVQGGALLANLQSLSTRVDAASGYSQVLADMYSQKYVNTGTTTATIDYQFGQATLNPISIQDLLIQTDVYGKTYISDQIEFSYSLVASPGVSDFVPDPNGIEMLLGNRVWIQTEINAGTTVWCKIKTPLQYLGASPNVMEIWPIPMFGIDITEVSYQGVGQNFSSSWTPLDLTYLPGYNTSTQTVQQAGPLRLFLPNQAISQIRIGMKTRSNTSWGLFKLKLYHYEWNSQAALTIIDPYNRTITATTLRGMNPSTLANLSVSTSTNSATINLVSTGGTSSTPVITGVILAV